MCFVPPANQTMGTWKTTFLPVDSQPPGYRIIHDSCLHRYCTVHYLRSARTDKAVNYASSRPCYRGAPVQLWQAGFVHASQAQPHRQKDTIVPQSIRYGPPSAVIACMQKSHMVRTQVSFGPRSTDRSGSLSALDLTSALIEIDFLGPTDQVNHPSGSFYATTLVLMGSIYRVVVQCLWRGGSGGVASQQGQKESEGKTSRCRSQNPASGLPSIALFFRRGIRTIPGTSSAGIHQHTTRQAHVRTSTALV